MLVTADDDDDDGDSNLHIQEAGSWDPRHCVDVIQQISLCWCKPQTSKRPNAKDGGGPD